MSVAVLDTNVLLSIAATNARADGVLSQLRTEWFSGNFRHMSSRPIYEETTRHLHAGYYARHVSEHMRRDLEIRLATEIVELESVRLGIASHPEDDLVMGIALQEDVDYFVTGDKQLLLRDGFEGLRIVNPRAFLDILTAGTA